MSDSVWPHRWQPTRLPRPWGSPGKNTGVGCHFLLQCRKVKSESEVAQPSPILSDPMNCNLPGSSVHGIFQWLSAVILKSRKMKSATVSIFPHLFALKWQQSHPRWKGRGGEFRQNVVCWRREWQTTSYSCIKNPMNSMKQQKDFQRSYLDLGHSLESVREEYVGGGLS